MVSQRNEKTSPQASKTIKARLGIMILSRAFVLGAGDGDRTRAVSLGSAWITPRRGAELGFGAVVSDRD